jgi:hypothetical protein
VTASDTVHLGLDRLEVAQRPREVARPERAGPLHERQHHPTRERMPLGVEGAQAVLQPRQAGFVPAGRVGQRGVGLTEEVPGARDALGDVGERAPR